MQQMSMPKPAYLLSIAEQLKTSRWAWCFLVVLAVSVRHFLNADALPFSPKFGGTDDALRLVQIRDLLTDGNWYDTRIPAIGAPEALNSHWSRLIDLPIAGLISFFALFTSTLQAEALAQVAWPLTILLALCRLLVFVAESRAGIGAGIAVLGVLVLTPTGLLEFLPGRIDHHSTQILCAAGGILLLQQAITRPATGWWAGSLLALGLTVGLEALPLVAASLGLACLLVCFDTRARDGACHTVIALALGLVAGFVITAHPSAWLNVACDALSLNLLALCSVGAIAAYILQSRFHDAPAWLWVGGFAASGVIGLGAYLGTNPACTEGAFAGLDDIVKTEWLFTVIESKTLLELATIRPSLAFSFLAVVVLALVVLVRQAREAPTTDHIFLATSTLLAGLYGFYFVKLMPYGALLAVVPIACWIARLPAIGDTSPFSVRLIAVIASSQMLFMLLIGIVIGLGSNAEAAAEKKLSASVTSCMIKDDIAALSKLPPGLIISDIDLGPLIALATHHRAYAGPYHRLHKSIRELIILRSAPLSEARQQLAKMNANYLVLCAVTPEPDTKAASGTAAKFSTHMRQGGRFDGLEPVSIGKTKGPLRVWKIVKAQ